MYVKSVGYNLNVLPAAAQRLRNSSSSVARYKCVSEEIVTSIDAVINILYSLPEIPKILSRVRGSVTNNKGFWIGCLDLLALLLQSLITAHNR
jgi:hypothetical protein